jgi:hypothetical protein
MNVARAAGFGGVAGAGQMVGVGRRRGSERRRVMEDSRAAGVSKTASSDAIPGVGKSGRWQVEVLGSTTPFIPSPALFGQPIK